MKIYIVVVLQKHTVFYTLKMEVAAPRILWSHYWYTQYYYSRVKIRKTTLCARI